MTNEQTMKSHGAPKRERIVEFATSSAMERRFGLIRTRGHLRVPAAFIRGGIVEESADVIIIGLTPESLAA